jgi:hypothetical protein
MTAHHPALPSRAGAVAAAAYVGGVAVLEVARGLRPGDLASSPSGVAAGRVWQLVTSGLVVAGDPVVQLPAVALVIAVVVAMYGPGAFWRAALAGHIGATLVVYAGVGVLWLVWRSQVDTVLDAPDYGISCVWAGAAGALVAGPTRSRALRRLGIAAAAAFVVTAPFASDLAGAEHVVAFAMGALVTAWWPPKRTARTRPTLPDRPRPTVDSTVCQRLT